MHILVSCDPSPPPAVSSGILIDKWVQSILVVAVAQSKLSFVVNSQAMWNNLCRQQALSGSTAYTVFLAPHFVVLCMFNVFSFWTTAVSVGVCFALCHTITVVQYGMKQYHQLWSGDISCLNGLFPFSEQPSVASYSGHYTFCSANQFKMKQLEH